MIHEFIADNKAVTNANAADFASMLLVATFPTHQYKLTNPFFFSPIKRRLIMLTQNKNPKFSYARRLVVLPLFAAIVLLFAFRKKETTTNYKTEKKYKVVIDAGHGGTDLGCKSVDGNVYEKDIDLAIAKAIKQLNNNKNIEIILTREDDHFDHVREKANFISSQNADLCVSIHCMDGEDYKANGTEIYVVSPERDNGFMNESKLLAQNVNGFLKNDFTSRGIKTRKTGIWILQATNCPIILVEAGFLSNKKDAAILQKVDKQELIATDILKGIENYLAQKESDKSVNNNRQSAKDTIQVVNLNGDIVETRIDTKATAEEMAEYLKLTEKYKKQPKKFMGYNFEKISKAEEERMFAIFCKMNKEQQETLHVYFVRPLKPSAKSVPTKQQLNSWATNKAYGVWIDDGNQISNNQLQKYSASEFSNFSISRLEKNAINYGKHYHQVNLMTNNYYETYIKQSSEKKYLLCWGTGLKHSLFAKANRGIDKKYK